MNRVEKISHYRDSLEQLEHLLGAEGKYELDDIGKMATIATVLCVNDASTSALGRWSNRSHDCCNWRSR